MGFSRQEYWSELPFLSPGDLPDPGIELTSLKSSALTGGSFTTSTTSFSQFWDAPHPVFFPFTFSNLWAWDASWCNRGWPGGSCDTVVISCLCADLVIPVHGVGLQLSTMHDQFSCHVKCMHVQSLSCVWFYSDLMGCKPFGSSVPGISQARILEWVAISSSRGSSWPRDQTRVSCIAGRFFTTTPPGKPAMLNAFPQIILWSAVKANVTLYEKEKWKWQWEGWSQLDISKENGWKNDHDFIFWLLLVLRWGPGVSLVVICGFQSLRVQ